MQRHDLRRVAGPVILAALLTSCAQPQPPGVKVRSVVTDLGLGVEKSTPPALPALPEIPPLPDFLPILRPPLPPIGPPVEVCKEAGLFDFPEREATAGIVGQPEPGRYRWKYDIRVLDPKRAAPYLPSDVSTTATKWRVFGSRIYRAFRPDVTEQISPAGQKNILDRGSFSYTVEQYPGLGPSPATRTRGDIIRTQPSSYLDTGPTSEDVGEGVRIETTSWSEYDPQTKSLKPYLLEHAPPLQISEAPIATGKTLTAASNGAAVNANTVDPTQSGSGGAWTFALQETVKGRARVDACGDMVDSWLYHGTLTLKRDADVQILGYDYGIASQLGGMVVYERLAYPADNPAVVVVGGMGQLHPDPIND